MGTSAFDTQVSRSTMLLRAFLNDRLAGAALAKYLADTVFPLAPNAQSGGSLDGFVPRNGRTMLRTYYPYSPTYPLDPDTPGHMVNQRPLFGTP